MLWCVVLRSVAFSCVVLRCVALCVTFCCVALCCYIVLYVVLSYAILCFVVLNTNTCCIINVSLRCVILWNAKCNTFYSQKEVCLDRKVMMLTMVCYEMLWYTYSMVVFDNIFENLLCAAVVWTLASTQYTYSCLISKNACTVAVHVPVVHTSLNGHKIVFWIKKVTFLSHSQLFRTR